MAKAKRDEPVATDPAIGVFKIENVTPDTFEVTDCDDPAAQKRCSQLADRARAKAIRELFADCDRDTLRDHLIAHSATVEEATAARKQIETDDYTSPRGGVFGKLPT